MLRIGFLLIIFSVLFQFTVLLAQHTKIFWVHEDSYNGKVQSANIDGTNLNNIITEKNMPCGLAIDWQSDPQKLYYCERGEEKIVRTNLDGSQPEDVITGISGIRDIELDPVNRKIYWVRDTWGDDAVQRANMDSLNSQIEDLFTSTSIGYGFYGIGLDLKNEKVYWTQAYNGCSDKIRRMNFDKTGFETIIVYPQSVLLSPWDIDVAGDKIYWTDCGLSEDVILYANLDGTQIDTVIKEVDCQFFTIDSSASKIYWTENYKISCANLDGSERTELVTGLGFFLMGIALAYNVPATAIPGEKLITTNFALHQNYPNPFNPTTTIKYSLAKNSKVILKVYNALGQEIRALIDKDQNAGYKTVLWDGKNKFGHDVSSGLYFYRLETNEYVKTLKALLLR